MPTRLPEILRRCPGCASERLRPNGKFRVNAHHKLLDVWLLALCAGCGTTARLTVMERTPVRAIAPDTLDRLHANDAGLAAELLQDPAMLHRNRIALDWTGAWRLDAGPVPPPDQDTIDVRVRFAARIPVRPVRLVAEGFGLARAEVERLVESGSLVSAVRLNARLTGDFTFTLKR
ncbi:DUF1062 domain-containing protein [Streptomyces smaragdinus]|uniref:DUF1062 domain-containing protein n=1 Tax=Streptomyces smaragdinus TaxID=2585196 RepID=UPI00389A61C0